MEDNFRILFCNIGYMKFYNGSYENDNIQNGGEYVNSHNSGGEVINFDYNRDSEFVFGFVETKRIEGYNENEYSEPNQLHIENIDNKYKQKNSVDDVLIVFCAKSPIMERTVIIGWYEHATAYRFRKRFAENNANGFGFNFKVKKENAHLIPESERIYSAKRAKRDGIGFGQSNVWYPMKHTAKKGLRNYIDNVINYLNDIILNLDRL